MTQRQHDDKRKKEKNRQDKLQAANPEAWDAARKVAKSIRNERRKHVEWGKMPWREIREQLRRTGTVVDITKVTPNWTTESPQMSDMLEILEKAGFQKVGHLYRWED